MKSTAMLRRLLVALAFTLSFAPLFLHAQAPAQQMSAAPAASSSNGGKAITIEDYARFKRIGGASISADGKWMMYTVTPNDGDGALFIQSLDTATKHEIPRGTGASFSDTSRWVAYFIAPPAADAGDAAAPAVVAARRRPRRRHRARVKLRHRRARSKSSTSRRERRHLFPQSRVSASRRMASGC